MTLKDRVKGFELYIINKVLRDFKGNKTKAAKFLGIKRTTLVMKLKNSKEEK